MSALGAGVADPAGVLYAMVTRTTPKFWRTLRRRELLSIRYITTCKRICERVADNNATMSAAQERKFMFRPCWLNIGSPVHLHSGLESDLHLHAGAKPGLF